MKIINFALLCIGIMFVASCSNNSTTSADAKDASVAENIQPMPIERMTTLLRNMNNWSDFSNQDKASAVKTVMNIYQTRENTAMMKSPNFYVEKINAALTQNSAFVNFSLPSLLKIVSVMEYDFYNGQNKDDLAMQVLGPKMYESNKKRLKEENKTLTA